MMLIPIQIHRGEERTQFTFSVRPWAVRIAKRLTNMGSVVGWGTFWAGIGDWIMWPPSTIEGYEAMQKVFPGDVSMQPVWMTLAGAILLVLWSVPNRQSVRFVGVMLALLWCSFVMFAFIKSDVGSGAGLHFGLSIQCLVVLYGMRAKELKRGGV